jgi:hypothetical protein
MHDYKVAIGNDQPGSTLPCRIAGSIPVLILSIS